MKSIARVIVTVCTLRHVACDRPGKKRCNDDGRLKDGEIGDRVSSFRGKVPEVTSQSRGTRDR